MIRKKATLVALVGACLCAGQPVAAGAPERWALLVTGSKTFDNYRHHADTAHAYQRLVAGGVPKSNIVAMQFNDVPGDPDNPYPNTLFNKPSGKLPGVDLNKNLERSYENTTVNLDNFLAALTCRNNTGPCVGPPTTANATLFIFWAGHGGDLFLLFPDMQTENALYGNVLVAALRKVLGGAQGFARIVVYIEACDSGSMFDGLLTETDKNILAITASGPTEDSYPAYCCVFERPPSCTVKGQDIGECLGDLFSVAVWQDADLHKPAETIGESFFNAKAKTRSKRGNPGSTVTKFGDDGLLSAKLADFIGEKMEASPATVTEDVDGLSIGGGGQGEFGASVNDADAGKHPDPVADLLADSIPLEHDVATKRTVPPTTAEFECYRRLNSQVDRRCGIGLGPQKRSQPMTKRYSVMLRACLEDKEVVAAAAIAAVCA